MLLSNSRKTSVLGIVKIGKRQNLHLIFPASPVLPGNIAHEIETQTVLEFVHGVYCLRCLRSAFALACGCEP